MKSASTSQRYSCVDEESSPSLLSSSLLLSTIFSVRMILASLESKLFADFVAKPEELADRVMSSESSFAPSSP